MAKNTPNPRDINEIRMLLSVCEYGLNYPEDHLETIIWRLVDAAGLALKNLHPENAKGLIGVEIPTGRGFRLEVK